jgi:hypothetical protein
MTSSHSRGWTEGALCYADPVSQAREQDVAHGSPIPLKASAFRAGSRAVLLFVAATIAACAPQERSTSSPAPKSSTAAPSQSVAPAASKSADTKTESSDADTTGSKHVPLTKPSPAALLTSVALLPSAAQISDYNRTISVEPSYLPPGNVASGGEGGPTPRQYLAMVEAEETRRTRMALAGAKTELLASCFLVAFEVSAPSSAVLLTVAKDGSIERRFPVTSKPDLPNRFEPGAQHVLPRKAVVITPESERIDAVDFDPGFRMSAGTSPGSGDVTVVFGLAAAPLERDTVGKLDALVAEIASTTSSGASAPAADASARSSGRLEVWLAENGFAVRELHVRAP